MRVHSFAVALTSWLFTAAAPAGAQSTTFMVDGSQSTFALAVNAGGAVTGGYVDDLATNVIHGFVRDPLGVITKFDPPGATGGSYPAGISDQGAVTGYYYDAVGTHGFVRDAAGKFTVFDAPAGSSTLPAGINASGAVTGVYYDSLGVHGFVRDSQGAIASFEAGAPGYYSTFATSINADGSATGYYSDTDPKVIHGFIRDPLGVITTFDASPQSTQTFCESVNVSGEVTGFYYVASPAGSNLGFVRDAKGTVTSFDWSGSGYPTSFAYGINAGGMVTGSDFSPGAFVRDPRGNITSFQVPFAASVNAQAINASGAVTGYFLSGMGNSAFVARAPNTMDISRTSGNVANDVWLSAYTSGVRLAVVESWRGESASPYTQDQLSGDGTTTIGANGYGMKTGAYVLLNYFNQYPGSYQVNQAIKAVGTGKSALKFMVVVVEPCCGEFVAWKPSTGYSAAALIMDRGKHIQKAITGGTSGTNAPKWNDAGGQTTDGTVTWMDTGKSVMGQEGRVDQISAAVAQIQQSGLKAMIRTDRRSWKEITGDCGGGAFNNCSSLMSIPLWDTEPVAFVGADGLKHCGDGIAGLYSFAPYSGSGWQSRSGNQYDFGLMTGAVWCQGVALFGLTQVNFSYLDPALFH